jgi:hypothetical protein
MNKNIYIIQFINGYVGFIHCFVFFRFLMTINTCQSYVHLAHVNYKK